MEASEARIRLLGEFERDAARLTEDMEEHARLRPLMLAVMADLLDVIGGEGTKLCMGSVAREIQDPDPGSGAELVHPQWPNQYDFTVVTGGLIVNTWGYFNVETGEISPETTTVKARSKVTGIRQIRKPGLERHGGLIATHHEVELAFADGSKESLPGLEEELSPFGCRRMAELVRALYLSMAG
jgi:hypothetical protein